MENVLFLQSGVADPYAIYHRMLADAPVYRDERNGIWAVYSHADCRRVLHSPAAHIPGQHPAAASLLNEQAATVANRLARLANPPSHPAFRQAVMRLFERMRPPADIAGLLARLLGDTSEVDWVGTVCRKLPALAVMEGFGFTREDIDAILPQVEHLTRIMLPNKSEQQISDINAVVPDIYARVERHAIATGLCAAADSDDLRAIYVSNLVGLLIQSYDAGRGILSNALVRALAHDQYSGWEGLVIETLRFDPPIHNTRRVLVEDLEIGGRMLKSGETILVVLAAANRDPAVFTHPAQFDPSRGNNREHLTFGAGLHQCAAQHFSVRLAADALAALFADGRQVELRDATIAYEPMVNARLPQRMIISIM